VLGASENGDAKRLFAWTIVTAITGAISVLLHFVSTLLLDTRPFLCAALFASAPAVCSLPAAIEHRLTNCFARCRVQIDSPRSLSPPAAAPRAVGSRGRRSHRDALIGAYHRVSSSLLVIRRCFFLAVVFCRRPLSFVFVERDERSSVVCATSKHARREFVRR
jgi:hypothetical protein